MIKQRTFYEFLVAHEARGGSDDLFGDFASDAVRDESFPCGIKANSSGFIEVFNYLYFTKNVKSNVIVAFMESWQEYYMITNGRRWEDWEDDNL